MPGQMPPLDLSRQVAEILKRLQRLERSAATPTTGGFDPNADPVVIGSGANGNSYSGAIVIGLAAIVNATDDIAIGDNAAANNAGVAIGASSVATGGNSFAAARYASATGDDAIGIGNNSDSTQQDGIAIGTTSHCHYTRGVAIGRSTVVAHAGGVAIGDGAATDRAGQSIFGPASGSGHILEVTGASGVLALRSSDNNRWEISVDTSGALVTAAVA